MQFNEVDWTPVLIALAIGAVAGAILVVTALRRKGSAQKSDLNLERRDLEVERDDLVSQLRELDDTAAKASEEELAKIRFELELKLASVLRELEMQAGLAKAAVRIGERDVEPVAPAADPFATLRGFLWGIGGAAAIAGLVVFLLQTAEPKEPPMPAAAAGAMGAAQDPELAQLEAAVQAQPENLDLRIELARAYLVRNDMNAVASLTDYVLQKSPDHPRALSYAALVQVQMGRNERALEMLKTALAKDPALMDGWIHLALVYSQMGRLDDAKAAIASAKEKHPQDAAMLDGFWREIEQQAASQTATAEPHGPHGVDGVVQITGGATLPANAALFLIARDSTAPTGPPVAVKRLPATSFPVAFHLDSADSMMGQPLPASMTIEARLDTDGNPMASNNEPTARAENVALGATGVQLVLQ